MRSRYGHVMRLAIIRNSLRHGNGIGKGRIIGIDITLVRGNGLCHFHDLRIGISHTRFVFPHFQALFQKPQSGDIFQETGSPVDTALVREIHSISLVCDNRLFRFYAHQRPSAGAEISEVTSRCRHGRHRRCRIVTGNSYNGNSRQSDFGRYIVPQVPDYPTRHNDRRKFFYRNLQRFQQPFFYPASFGIHQLGGRQYSIFTHLFSGEQIRDGIGHKQDAAHPIYVDTTFEAHRIKLE